jgi:hypothetical protein
MANDDQADPQTESFEPWEGSASSPDFNAMSSASPVDQYGNKVGGGSGYGSGQSDSGKSPLSMSLGFLKTLTEKKSTRGALLLVEFVLRTDCRTVDGQPPKRRGPKPDSKPALTRRQELNRQAQRYVLTSYV